MLWEVQTGRHLPCGKAKSAISSNLLILWRVMILWSARLGKYRDWKSIHPHILIFSLPNLAAK